MFPLEIAIVAWANEINPWTVEANEFYRKIDKIRETQRMQHEKENQEALSKENHSDKTYRSVICTVHFTDLYICTPHVFQSFC